MSFILSLPRRSFGVALLLFCISWTGLWAQENAPTVRLTIDYGDGVQKSFVALAWHDKMTVFDALQAAEKHSRGIRVAHTGSGETTFITAIDDLANEGQDARNWRYIINDKPARYSAGVAELKPGDSIVWRFGK